MRTVTFCYPAARLCLITASGQNPRTANSHSPFGSTDQESGQFQQAAVSVFDRPRRHQAQHLEFAGGQAQPARPGPAIR